MLCLIRCIVKNVSQFIYWVLTSWLSLA